MAYEITESCISCGVCEAECLQGAIHVTGADGYAIDPRRCQCEEGVDYIRCRDACPVDAIRPVEGSYSRPPAR